jgi:hypothetical protein
MPSNSMTGSRNHDHLASLGERVRFWIYGRIDILIGHFCELCRLDKVVQG